MNKNKKLSPGVTLVEVIVAMTIFAIMAGSIMFAIYKANYFSNRAKARDVEIATETNIIGRSKAKSRDQLVQVEATEGYTGDYKVVFNVPGRTVDPVDNVKVYETHEGRFDQDFDFKLKTIAKEGDFNGYSITTLADYEYLLRFKNELAESITITIKVTDGHLFEGSGQKYIHTTPTYVKTIPANSTADIGYFYNGAADIDVKFKVETSISGSAIQGQHISGSVSKSGFDPDIRKLTLTFKQSGTDPSFGGTLDYEH